MAPEIITRADARAQGLKRYFNGTPCKAGHLTERITLGGVCCQCYRDHFAKRRREHISGKALDAGVIIGLKQARCAGLSHYFTGNPCKRGHVEKRHTSNGSCLKCDQEKQAAAQWHVRNRSKHNANGLAWTAKNRDKAREIKRIAGHKRRAIILGSGGTHTATDLAEIFTAQGGKCAYCKASLTKVKKHVDHIQPLARGGSNGRENIQFLCAPCNQTKSAKDPIEYAQSIGLLL